MDIKKLIGQPSVVLCLKLRVLHMTDRKCLSVRNEPSLKVW